MGRKKILIKIFLLAALIFPSACLAYMSSGQYTIFADTIEAGGSFSDGGGYLLEDTIGESTIGNSENVGKGYFINAGYQAMDRAFLEASFSTTTISLGTLDVNSVATSSIVVTISTDATQGYRLSMISLFTAISRVLDGSVTAGQEEFGVAVVGVDAAFANDQLSDGLLLAASTTPVTDSEIEVIFKAAIDSSVDAGDYSYSPSLQISLHI